MRSARLSSRARIRLRRVISSAAVAGVLGAAVAAGVVTSAPSAAASSGTWCGDDGTPAVIALQDTHFYIDSSSTAQLLSSYAGYRVEAGASSRKHLYLGWSDFTGGVLSLAANQPSSVALPPLLSGGGSVQYALLTASGVTTTPQAHTVTVYDGPPAMGGTPLCSRTFTYADVVDTIKALANKVTSVTASPPSDPALIGDTVSVTVQGNTGTLGAGPDNDPGVLGYTPNALSSFPVSAWRLERTELTISPDGVAPPRTYVDRLFLSGASGPARPYTAHYTFRAVGPSVSPAQLKPIQYIASGTQVKHTDIGGTALYALPAVSSDGPVTLVKELTSPASGVLPEGGGQATYSVTLTNSSSRTAQVDDVTDTLPVDATFVPGSLTVDGVLAPEPLISDRSVLVQGPLTVPADGTTVIRYAVQLGSTSGIRVNSAVAHLGPVSYDTTTDVTTTAPATAEVSVLGSAGPTLQPDTAATDAGTPVTVDVLANDTTPSELPLHVTTLGPPSTGNVSLTSSGDVVFTPAARSSGTATFTYTATDGYSTGTGTVTVTVSPLAAADTYSTGKGTTLTSPTSVLANDACSSCTVSATLVQPPMIDATSGGTVTMSADGTFTYVPPSNVTGTVTFRYRETDPTTGLTSDGDVTINLADLAPDLATTGNATPVSIDVKANDKGCAKNCQPQPGNSADSAPTRGTVDYSGGVATYTPTGTLWGLDRFAYGVTGSTGSTVTWVTVLVAPPTKALRTTYGTTASAALPSGGSCAGCTYTLGSAPGHGSVSIGSTGGATYRPTAGYAGADSFTYLVTDPTSGLTVSGATTVTVGPDAVDDVAEVLLGSSTTGDVATNDACPSTCTRTVLTAPATGTLTFRTDGTWTYRTGSTIAPATFTYRVSSSVSGSATDDATVRISVRGAVDDTATTAADTSVVVGVRGNDPCDGCTLTALGEPTSGDVAVDGSGIRFTPDAGTSGRSTFTYTLSESGASTTATVTVVVLPKANADSLTVVSGGTAQLIPTSNDVCTHCTVTSVGAPASGTATRSGDVVTYTVADGSPSSDTFTYTAVDGEGNSVTGVVNVTVVPAPQVTDDSASVLAQSTTSIDVAANDGCTTCDLATASDPQHGTVSVAVDGRMIYTPEPRWSGRDAFTYVATDPSTGARATAAVQLVVRPVAVDDSALTGVGQDIVVDVLLNDACTSCTVALGEAAGPADVVVVPGGVQLRPATPGVVTVPYTATDPVTGESASATLTLTISDARPDATTTAAATPVTLDVLSNDTCAGCLVQTVQSISPAGSGTAVATGTTVTVTPADGFAGVITATYTATADGGTPSVSSALRVLVTPSVTHLAVAPGRVITTSVLDVGACPGCTVRVLTGPSGDLDSNGTGTFTYTAPPDTGEDSWTYRLTDPTSMLSVDSAVAVDVIEPGAPALTITTTASEPSAVPAAGDEITWAWVVANSGDTPLIELDVRSTAAVATCPVTSLEAGESTTCSGVRTLTQSDVDAGQVADTATASASGPTEPVSDEDSFTVALTRAPALSVVATSSVGTAPSQPGDVVSVEASVTSTGNTTLSALTAGLDGGSALTCSATELAPGARTTCRGTAALSSTDVEAGRWAGNVTATAEAPGTDDPVTAAGPTSAALVPTPATTTSTEPSTTTTTTTTEPGATSTSTTTEPSATSTSTTTGPTTEPTTSPTTAPTTEPTTSTTTGPSATTTSITSTASASSTTTEATAEPTTAPSPIISATTAPSPATSSTATPTPSTTGATPPGLSSSGTVSGTVWFDRNQDGDQDSGEWPLPGVRVVLTASTSGPLAALALGPAPLRLTATSDARGAYSFTGVAAGSYRVIASVVADGFSYSSDTDGLTDWIVAVRVTAGATTTASFAGLGHGTLSATVVTTTTGMPVPYAEVTCVWAGFDDAPGTPDDLSVRTVSGADGSVTLQHVPYGAFSCRGEDARSHVASATVRTVVASAVPVRMKLPLAGASTAAARALPRTGTDAGTLSLFALGGLLGGTALVLLARPSRRNTE